MVNLSKSDQSTPTKLAGRILPGLAFALAMAVAAIVLADQVAINEEKVISEVIIAILIGLLIKAFIKMPAVFAPGIDFSFKKIIKVAIVLMGLNFSIAVVFRTGLSVLAVIIVSIIAAMILMELMWRLLNIRPSLARLIGIGTAICGASAIIAAAPIIDEADDSDITYAVATITIFGLLAIFVYPVLASFLQLSEFQYGRWVGVAIHETAQVLAAGFAIGNEAGEVATIVKLTRTVMLLPVIFSFIQVRQRGKASDQAFSRMLSAFPVFILGFLGFAVLRTAGDVLIIDSDLWTTMLTAFNQLSKFLIVVAMAGVGLTTDLTKIKKLGLKPLIAGLIASIFLGVFSLGLFQLLY